jgi:hypothetical protein
MVSPKAWLVVAAMSVACGAVGCKEAAAPEPWASAPVVVSAEAAASVTLRVDEKVVITGSEEPGSRGDWDRKLPALLGPKLQAAGFKIAPAGAPADLVVAIQATDVDWTGRFWEARGAFNLLVSNAADSSVVGKITAHFAGEDYNDVPETGTHQLVDGILRSAEVAAFVKAKHDREEAAKAPPPVAPVAPVAPPPPPPGLDAEAVRPVLARLHHRYHLCHERALATTPTLAGSVTLKINIAPNGSIESIAAEASTLNEAVNTCLIDVTKGATFPQAPGKTAYAHAIELKIAGEPPTVAKGGGHEPAVVHQGIHAAYEKIWACYETGLKKDPKMAGHMRLGFSISTKGAVPSVQIAKDKDSTLRDADLKKCVTEAIKSTPFAPAKKQSQVTYVLELQPPG